MRALGTIHDPVFEQPRYSRLDRFFLQFMRDERDLPFIYFMIRLTLYFIPLAIAAFLVDNSTWVWWVIFALYGGGLIYWAAPFILMMHNTSHRPFFKPEYKIWNRFIPWGLCPFMGQSPDTYFSHHIGMHHAENNLEHDRSTTMPFKRDSIIDFGRYFFRFLLIGVFELFAYLRFRKRKLLLKRAVVGEFFFYLLCIVLLFVNWKATLLVFILPAIFVRFSMMAGNWAQHAFIHPASPENSYTNSITCINSVYNRRCFNDGYHIGHHLNPSLHWTEMPKDFQKNINKYIDQGAVVFEKIDYFVIWLFLMLKRYDWLANYYVNIGNKKQSKTEVIDLLKSRTEPIPFH